VVLVLNTCGEDGARLRGGWSRSHVMFFKPVSRLVEQLLAEQLLAEQLLAERLLAEQLLDTEQLLAEQLLAEQFLTERLLAEQFLTERLLAEQILLRLMKKSSHVHITEKVLYIEVKRKCSVAYHRDPAAI